MSGGRISAAETAHHTSAWPFVLAVFAFSRLLFLGTGAIAAATLPWAEPIASVLGPPDSNYWAHWDGAWYSEIALYGYDYRAPMSTPFFPLFPMLLRVGTALGGGQPSGVCSSRSLPPLSLCTSCTGSPRSFKA